MSKDKNIQNAEVKWNEIEKASGDDILQDADLSSQSGRWETLTSGLKDGANNALDSFVEHPIRSVRNTIVNFVLKTVAVVAAIGGTFIRNLIFSQRDQLELGKTAANAQRLKNDRKENRNSKDEKETVKKDLKSEERDMENSQDKKSKLNDREFEEKKEKEIDPDLKDRATNLMLKDKDIQKVFDNIGYIVYPKQNTDNIYLFHKGENMKGNPERSFIMSKADLLTGNAKSLAKAIYRDKLSSDANLVERDTLKMQSSVMASIGIAAAQYLANKETFSEMSLNGKEMNLSKINLESLAGTTCLEIKGNPVKMNTVDFYINGQKINSLGVDELAGRDASLYFDELSKNVMDAYNKQKFKEFAIGDSNTSICFAKDKDGLTKVRLTGEKDKDLGYYAFKTESDVRKLAKILKAESPCIMLNGQKLNYQDIAFTIGMTMNHAMEPDRNQAGQVLNTYTGRPELDGAAHMNLVHNEYGAKLYRGIPEIYETGTNIEATWNNKNLSKKSFQKEIENTYNIKIYENKDGSYSAQGENTKYKLEQQGKKVLLIDENKEVSLNQIKYQEIAGITNNQGLSNKELSELLIAVNESRIMMRKSKIEVTDFTREASSEPEFTERNDYFDAPVIEITPEDLAEIIQEKNEDDVINGKEVSFEQENDDYTTNIDMPEIEFDEL